MKDIIQIAAGGLGTEEIPGQKHNDQIVAYAHESGMEWVNDEETPWCSIFMNWCAMKAGLTRSRKANARSWLNVGWKIDVPEPGDVVIFWRGSKDSWKGHVGLFLGYSIDDEHIFCLGGNQGNQVSITSMSATQWLGFRRLISEGGTGLPDGVLKQGDTGDAVKTVQEVLKMAGYEAGPSDGIFGPKTEEAVKELQSTNDDLSIDGVYGPETRSYLKELIGG